MVYRENMLYSEEYCRLRDSVGWIKITRLQAENILSKSLYTATAVNGKETIAMGRLIANDKYFMIVDVIVRPDFQNRKIGTSILNMLIDYVKNHTPAGQSSKIYLISEKGKEHFYENLGFVKIPHKRYSSSMRKIIYN